MIDSKPFVKKTGKGDFVKCLLNVKCDIRLYLIKSFAEVGPHFSSCTVFFFFIKHRELHDTGSL